MKINDFSVVPFNDDLTSVWDAIVIASKNGNFLHLRNYISYHSHRFDEQSIVIFKKNKPIAIFPCNRHGDQIISHGGLTYSGLIYGVDLHAVDILSIFEVIIFYYRGLGCESLIYKAIPHVFHRFPAEEDLYALFRNNANLIRRDISTVISLPVNIKWSDSRKNTIKKAEKNNITIREGDFLSDFHALLVNSLAQRGLSPVHSLEELALLHGRFPGCIRLLGAFKNSDELMAGALIYDFGHIAHTQYLISSDEGRKTGALDFLLANSINVIFSDRKYFSFGISTEHSGKYLNEGLIFQKEGFGGRAVVHDVYKLSF